MLSAETSARDQWPKPFGLEHLSSGVALPSSIQSESEADRFVYDLAGWLRCLQRDDTTIADASPFWVSPNELTLGDISGWTPGIAKAGSSNEILKILALDSPLWHRASFVRLTDATLDRFERRVPKKLRADAGMWSSLHQSITRWASLPDGWDGEDGTAPPAESVQNAADFLGKLHRLNIHVPSGFVAGDGEIGFRWRSGDDFASAAFLPDGHLVATARVKKAPPVKIDAPYSPTMNLRDLLKALTRFV